MHLRLLGSFTAALAAVALQSALAADLDAVPRTIAKEPTYTSKPAYCLLVLGAEAVARVWVVRDGDTVYVDRNGNGDLTEAGERVEGTSEVKDSPDMRDTLSQFTLGDLLRMGDRRPYVDLTLTRRLKEPKSKDVQGGEVTMVKLTLGAGSSSAGSTQSSFPVFAADAAGAPIVHLDGPLTMRVDAPSVLLIGAEPQLLNVEIGTLGVGTRTWAALGYEQIARDLHPQVEITYPPAVGGEPITMKSTLDTRC